MRNIIGLRSIKLADIEMDPGLQMRAAISEETVHDYQAVFEAGGNMPPVTLFYDGERYWPGDGFHRMEGRRRAAAGDDNAAIEAEVRSGTRRDALLLAIEANKSHGLRRTNADKRRVVETMLRDDEWGGWSNRRIADHCGVSDPFVGKIREELGLPEPELRVGLDGRSRSVTNEPVVGPPRTRASAKRSQSEPETNEPVPQTPSATSATVGATTKRTFTEGATALHEELLLVADCLRAMTARLPGPDPVAAWNALREVARLVREHAKILKAGAESSDARKE